MKTIKNVTEINLSCDMPEYTQKKDVQLNSTSSYGYIVFFRDRYIV